MSVWCQQATLQAWLETKRDANRGAPFDELLRVVRLELTAEQRGTLASIAASARDDRGVDVLVAERGAAQRPCGNGIASGGVENVDSVILRSPLINQSVRKIGGMQRLGWLG